MTGEWLTPNTADMITWASVSTGTSSFHQVQLQANQSFIEGRQDRANDVTMILATQSDQQVSIRVAHDVDARGQFPQDGSVSGTSIVPPAQMGNPYPVFAITKDLGNITQTSSPMVWAIGAYRNPSISFVTSTGDTQDRAPLFVSSYSTISDVVDAFIVDHPKAKARADVLDERIATAGSNISAPFQALTALAARQAIGATELTISKGSDGQWNTSDTKMFMKDIGNSGRVNPVENIFAAFPFFLFINSTYAGQLLSPLLEFQDTSNTAQPFAARDIGQNYPKAVGNNVKHQQGVEYSGNMLIMSLAHARASGDGTLISRHYRLLRSWADYLVDSSICPPDVTTIDQEQQSNSTNLAIKGIIGIKAMAEISSALNQTADATYYSQFASTFASEWHAVALSTDGSHILPSYGSATTSWAQMYNLFADRLLGTNLVDNNIYASQTQYYQTLISNSFQSGLPLDNTTDIANAAWTLFTAATVTDTAVRDSLIAPVWTHAVTSPHPLSVRFKVDSTDVPPTSGAASPAMGAMFAPLALNLPNLAIVAPPIPPAPRSSGSPADSSSKHRSAGPIAGGVISGLALVAFSIIGVLFWRKRRDKGNMDIETFPSKPMEVYTSLTLGSNDHSSPQDQTTQTSLPMIMSSKAREAMARMVQNHPAHDPSPNTSLASGSRSTPASSREPPTVASGSGSGPRGNTSRSRSANLSNTEVVGLRVEVENLKRVMQRLQVERVESPPSYAA